MIWKERCELSLTLQNMLRNAAPFSGAVYRFLLPTALFDRDGKCRSAYLADCQQSGSRDETMGVRDCAFRYKQEYQAAARERRTIPPPHRSHKSSKQRMRKLRFQQG